MFSQRGRPSIPPEHLLKGSLLIALYSTRSERQFCERLRYDLLFKWFLGLNIENVRALNKVEATLKVPGIAFAEWGPGDMAMSMGYKSVKRDQQPPELQAARDRIFAACSANGVTFLEGPEQARAHAGRTMPV